MVSQAELRVVVPFTTELPNNLGVFSTEVRPCCQEAGCLGSHSHVCREDGGGAITVVHHDRVQAAKLMFKPWADSIVTDALARNPANFFSETSFR